MTVAWFWFTLWAASGSMAAIAWGQGWAKREGKSLPAVAYPLLAVYGVIAGPALWVLAAAAEVAGAIRGLDRPLPYSAVGEGDEEDEW